MTKCCVGIDQGKFEYNYWFRATFDAMNLDYTLLEGVESYFYYEYTIDGAGAKQFEEFKLWIKPQLELNQDYNSIVRPEFTIELTTALVRYYAKWFDYGKQGCKELSLTSNNFDQFVSPICF